MRPIFVPLLHILVMLTQMCSQRAIVDSLECCLDDLIECFEDFVKKSLILIFVGIGIIVGLLCYLVKMVSERPPLNSSIVENTTHSQNYVNEEISNKNNKKVEQEVNEILKQLKQNECMKTDNINFKTVTPDTDIDKESTPTANNTSNVPMSPSFEENELCDVGLSACSKYGCGGGVSTHIYIPSRVPVPSIPTSSSKHKLIPCLRKRSLNKNNLSSAQLGPKITKPGSCCSMCCYDRPKQNEDLDRHIGKF